MTVMEAPDLSLPGGFRWGHGSSRESSPLLVGPLFKSRDSYVSLVIVMRLLYSSGDCREALPSPGTGLVYLSVHL